MIKTRSMFKVLPAERWKDLPQLFSRQPIVMVTGAFELLHPGHVAMLNFSARLGVVVVGLQGDESATALKGQGRPIQNQEDRAIVLSGLEAVKAVAVYETKDCSELITAARPEIFVWSKYYPDDAEIAALREVGAEIVQFTPIHDVSVGKILKKWKAE